MLSVQANYTPQKNNNSNQLKKLPFDGETEMRKK